MGVKRPSAIYSKARLMQLRPAGGGGSLSKKGLNPPGERASAVGAMTLLICAVKS